MHGHCKAAACLHFLLNQVTHGVTLVKGMAVSRLRHLNVAQTFLSAGYGGFPAASSWNTGLESPVNPAAAPRRDWKTCATKTALSANRKQGI